MAGDWIKLQKDTPDKPEVLAIASRLGIDPDAVTGKLIRIWSWFDTHTTNGNATSVTYAFLDRITGVTGFAEQVELVGWLKQSGHELILPNFDFHNGETAKKRAMGKNRAEKHRNNAESNADSVTKTSPEKRREEKSNTVAKATDGKPSLSPDEIIFSYGVPLLTNAGTADKQARSFLGGLRKAHGDDALVNALRECMKAKPLQPLEWLAAALPPEGKTKPKGQTFAERDAAAGRKRWEEMTGRKWPENETFIDVEIFTLGIEDGTTD
jgi:hypothetical protein